MTAQQPIPLLADPAALRMQMDHAAGVLAAP
jgi:hypothetical protein